MLMCGFRCEVRPLQIGGAHTCACAPKSGRARCVRATQKTVATHTLPIGKEGNFHVQPFTTTSDNMSLLTINP